MKSIDSVGRGYSGVLIDKDQLPEVRSKDILYIVLDKRWRYCQSYYADSKLLISSVACGKEVFQQSLGRSPVRRSL
jgi:hypothetical protein